MKLGVNVVRLTRPFTGVGRYIECLLREWSAMEWPFDEIVLYAPAPIREDLTLVSLDRFRVEIIGSSLPDPIWEWATLKRAARDVDVLLCPSYTLPHGYEGRCAVTYHGPARYRGWPPRALRYAAYDRLYRYSVRRADAVFACSDVVKRRVVDVYGVPSERVSVTYMAPSSHFVPITDSSALAATRRRFLGTDEPFILFVGKLSERHFIPEMLEAYAQAVRRAGLPHRLLVVGPDTLGFDVPRRARRMGLADRIIYVPFVKHVDLPPLYSAAESFLFPASEEEGFGIPVLEAMACGTPVISTNLGGVAELASDAALLVERSSVEELSAAIEKLSGAAALRERLRAAGLERAAGITWKQTAEKTMQRLGQLAER